MQLRSCGLLLALAAAAAPAFADDTNPYKVSVHTLITTPLVIEGLTSDDSGNLYAPAVTTAGQPCPVYKVNIDQRSSRWARAAPSATRAARPAARVRARWALTSRRLIGLSLHAERLSPPTATLRIRRPGHQWPAFDWNGNPGR